MSKGRARLAILALSAPLLVALSLVTACGAGEERPRPAPEAGEEPVSYKLREQNWEYWEGIEALLQRTLKGVSEARELSPPEEAQLRVVTANWATENWGHNYVKENSRKIEIDEWIWKALFILPDDVMLAELYAQWPGSYLLAVWEDKVYFVQDNFGKLGGGEAREAMAHEVVHLLQGRNFETPSRPTYDGDKAWSALVEGDAGFTRAKYLERVGHIEPEIGQLPPSALDSPAPGAEMPPALTRLFYFPYDYGEAFVSALYETGGWQAVNDAYRDPPATTEQVIHPEKYLIKESPSGVEALPLSIPGWQKERTDRLGEHFIRVMLQTWLSEPEAARAARGWGDDSLTCYEFQDDYLFAWQIAWDSKEDAAQFHDAFLRMLKELGAKEVGANLWLAQGKYLWTAMDNQLVLVVGSEDRAMMDSALPLISSLIR